ncbi:MAG: N-formylglutamate amidohydrolase [Sumerlaeia bacterium]
MRELPGLLLTCEHGGNHVPEGYRGLFAGQRSLLDSHRGWDPGTLDFGRHMARTLKVPLVACETTRLLCDLNRNLGHRGLFSALTKKLSGAERAAVLRDHYHPHRQMIASALGMLLEQQGPPVYHIGLHSFTPALDGKERRTEIGLLCDPSFEREVALCRRWQRLLRRAMPGLAVHLNAPYKGVLDCLSNELRGRFGEDEVVTVELEINQKFVGSALWPDLQEVLIETGAQALGDVTDKVVCVSDLLA